MSDWPDWNCKTTTEQTQLMTATTEELLQRLGLVATKDIIAMQKNGAMDAAVRDFGEHLVIAEFERARKNSDLGLMRTLVRDHAEALEHALRSLIPRKPGRPAKAVYNELTSNAELARKCRRLVLEIWRQHYEGRARRTKYDPPTADCVVVSVLRELGFSKLPVNWRKA